MTFLSSNPIVSVITPIFNSRIFIDRAIQSVLTQNINCEHIFIDDFSSDGSYDYLTSISAQFSHISILRNQSNFGPSYSRNFGISIAKGTFIAFLDADDIWLPDKLKYQIEFMKRNNLAISCTAFRKISLNSKKLGPLLSRSSPISYFSHLSTRYICCSSVLFDKSIISKFSFPILDKRLRVDDFYAWSKIINSGYIFGFLPRDLVRYTVVKNSRSSNFFIAIFSVIYLYAFYEKANYFTKLICFLNYIFFSLYKKIYFNPKFDTGLIDINHNWNLKK